MLKIGCNLKIFYTVISEYASFIYIRVFLNITEYIQIYLSMWGADKKKHWLMFGYCPNRGGGGRSRADDLNELYHFLDLCDLKGLKGLKGLTHLKGLKVLKGLKGLNGLKVLKDFKWIKMCKRNKE